MSRPPKSESWLREAVEMMVRDGVSLRQAASTLGVAVTTEDCETVQRRKSFQKLLWEARHRYHAEIAGDPARTKQATVGTMLVLGQRLIEQGDYDKAAEVLFKIARIEGQVGAESTVNVFQQLTGKDLEELKREFHQGHAQSHAQGHAKHDTTQPGGGVN